MRMARHHKITVERIREAASAVGLRFGETEYRGKDLPHKFICLAAGHVRMMSPGNILYRNAHCAKCRTPGRDSTVQDAQRLAARAGGHMLSKRIESVTAPLTWRCRDGHEWSTSLMVVRRGSWCPECNKVGISERQCRVALEQVFGTPFPKAHPSWMRTKGSRRSLELDGYSETLGIAFEYHGAQHFRRVPRFTGTTRRLLQIQGRDELRRTLCRRHGVVLIEIQEFPNPVINERAALIRQAILDGFIAAGRRPPHLPPATSLDLSPAFGQTLRERAATAARKRGGRLISRTFRGWRERLTWECARGHRWQAAPSSIMHGRRTWCPACAGQVGPSIVELRAKAQDRGWRLCSRTYTNAKVKLEWECPEGHRVQMSSDNFQRGKGCRVCKQLNAGAGQRHRLEDLQAEAARRGGCCLAKSYKNSATKVMWRCGRGHEWLATWGSVNSGSWCWQCYLLDRKRISP